MRSFWVIAVLAAACGSDTKTDTGSDTDTGTNVTNTCDPDVDSSFPEDGDTDAFYKTDVRFTLTGDDATASITVADAAGTAVNGTSTVAGSVVTWAGDDFAPSTEYTATLTYACGSESITFTTSATGAPTSTDVTGKVFNLNLAGGNWLQPAGLGDVIASLIGEYEILVSPLTIDGSSIDMLAGVATKGEQNVCAPTIPFPSATYADPFFELTAPELPLSVSGVEINITNLELSGAFAPDGSRIQGAVMKGKVDSRPLAAAFNFGTTDNAGCIALAAFGVQCEECDNGAGPYCITVNIEDLEALEVSTTLVPITDTDIENNPACVPATP